MEIRRSYDRLISTMGFPILVKWHLYIESGVVPTACFHMFYINNLHPVIITLHPVPQKGIITKYHRYSLECLIIYQYEIVVLNLYLKSELHLQVHAKILARKAGSGIRYCRMKSTQFWDSQVFSFMLLFMNHSSFYYDNWNLMTSPPKNKIYPGLSKSKHLNLPA